MIIKLIFSLLFSIAIGYFAVSVLLARFESRYFSNGLKLCLAVGSGFGISSSLYFLWLVTVGKTGYGFIIVETLILIVLIGNGFLIKKHPDLNYHFNNLQETSNSKVITFRILKLGFLSSMALCLTSFLLMSRILPNGGWDAWQTWNLFARFIYRGGVHWTDAFTPFLASHHPDYPLLIPGLVARSWQYMGAESQLAPIVIAFLFCFTTIWLLYASISIVKGRNQGYLAAIMLMGSISFVVLGTYQYADVPLGFYYLATLCLMVLQEFEPGNTGISFLTGNMAGFACWCKNEGLLFLLAIALTRLIFILSADDKKVDLKQLFFLGLGASPALALLLYFKHNLAPTNDLFALQALSQIMAKATNSSRYVIIFKSLISTTLRTNPLFFLAVFFPLYMGSDFQGKTRRGLLSVIIVMTIVFVGYLAVYVISPYDIEWHLNTSLSRLLMQLWPGFLFMIFVLARSPDQLQYNTNNVIQGLSPLHRSEIKVVEDK